MTKLNSAQMGMKLYPEDKDFLITWYQSVLNKELKDFKNSYVVPEDSVFKPEKEREIAFRTQSNEQESYLADFKTFVDQMPCAFFPMLKEEISKKESEGAILDELDDYRGAAGLLELVEAINEGRFELDDPNRAIDEYVASHGGRIYSEEALDDALQNDGWEVLDAETLQNAPEIKESRFYSKKDREMEWKREVKRLENEEIKRIADRKAAQSLDEGYRTLHYVAPVPTDEERRAQEALTEDQRKAQKELIKNQRKENDAIFADYAKENKKLDIANDAYHKAKLALDKLKAKRAIMGELSAKEEKTYQKYQKALIDATANLSSVKAQAVRDFKNKIAEEGKDINAPHHQIRLAQLRSADTRYMTFENAEVNERIYGDVLERLENERTAMPAPRVRNLDLSAYVSTNVQRPNRASADDPSKGLHAQKEPESKEPLQKDV